MALVNLIQIKNWFKTGLKPTQAQFWDVWDSFRHKDENIPLNEIENLASTLNDKADAEAFANHTNDLAQHKGALLPFISLEDGVVKKAVGNVNLEAIQVNDRCWFKDVNDGADSITLNGHTYTNALADNDKLNYNNYEQKHTNDF